MRARPLCMPGWAPGRVTGLLRAPAAVRSWDPQHLSTGRATVTAFYTQRSCRLVVQVVWRQLWDDKGRAAAGLTLGRGRVSAGPGLPLSGDTEHPERGWGGQWRAEATAQCPPPLHQPGAGFGRHLPVWPQGATLGPGQDPNQLWPRGPCSCLSQRCCLLSPRPSLTSTTCGPAP